MVLANPLSVASVALLAVLLVACEPNKSAEQQQTLVLPERLDAPHVTDQMTAAGMALALWDDAGGCKLQVGKAAPSIWLKPMAPCYFIKSPGAELGQVYRHDKTTSVVAVVGTPVKGKRCGQEVQGLVLKGNTVTPSTYVMQGSVHCAEQGLHNFQYDLFTR